MTLKNCYFSQLLTIFKVRRAFEPEVIQTSKSTHFLRLEVLILNMKETLLQTKGFKRYRVLKLIRIFGKCDNTYVANSKVLYLWELDVPPLEGDGPRNEVEFQVVKPEVLQALPASSLYIPKKKSNSSGRYQYIYQLS